MNYHHGPEGRSAEDLLAESVRYQKKASARAAVGVFAHVMLILVLAAAVAAAVMLAPRVNGILTQVEESLDEIGGILDDVQSVASSAKTLIEEDGDALQEAVGNLNEVDFSKLNDAIRNLNDAVGSLAEFARKLP